MITSILKRQTKPLGNAD